MSPTGAPRRRMHSRNLTYHATQSRTNAPQTRLDHGMTRFCPPRWRAMPVPGPRHLLADPARFGYSNASWPQIPTDPPARAELVTAFYVHQVVLALRRTLTEQGVSQRELADRLGVSAETLGRKIRGETWAGLTDILAWALELGVDLLPVPAEREELLPPGL